MATAMVGINRSINRVLKQTLSHVDSFLLVLALLFNERYFDYLLSSPQLPKYVFYRIMSLVRSSPKLGKNADAMIDRLIARRLRLHHSLHLSLLGWRPHLSHHHDHHNSPSTPHASQTPQPFPSETPSLYLSLRNNLHISSNDDPRHAFPELYVR